MSSMRRALTAETFLTALAVLTAPACARKSENAPAAVQEPPAQQTAVAAPTAPPPATTTDHAATPVTATATEAPAAPPPVAASATPPKAKKLGRPMASAGCGANGCSPDMKKGGTH